MTTNSRSTIPLTLTTLPASQGVYLCLRICARRAFWKNLMQNYKSSESYYTTRVSRGVPVSEGTCKQGFLENLMQQTAELQILWILLSYYTTRVSRGAWGFVHAGLMDKHNNNKQQNYKPLTLTTLPASQGVYLCLRVCARRAFLKNLMQQTAELQILWILLYNLWQRGVPVSEGTCSFFWMNLHYNYKNCPPLTTLPESQKVTWVLRCVPVSEGSVCRDPSLNLATCTTNSRITNHTDSSSLCQI